ncbi:MAG: hypothetical protein EOM76_00170, partial [Sphingobacteriia bacterium]|nr:hypothetical protein [Sphingobacteriia bacterium]
MLFILSFTISLPRDINEFSPRNSIVFGTDKEYSLNDVLRDRVKYPQAQIVSHPECKPEVCQNSDFVGSTSQMLNYIKDTHAERDEAIVA